LVAAIWLTAIFSLAFLGGLSAQAGGAGIWRSACRVALWGALAMGATSLIGSLFSVSV
jgi:VIT1/CCC1 family predicted Fe2+/Mn2+ transporter